MRIRVISEFVCSLHMAYYQGITPPPHTLPIWYIECRTRLLFNYIHFFNYILDVFANGGYVYRRVLIINTNN